MTFHPDDHVQRIALDHHTELVDHADRRRSAALANGPSASMPAIPSPSPSIRRLVAAVAAVVVLGVPAVAGVTAALDGGGRAEPSAELVVGPHLAAR